MRAPPAKAGKGNQVISNLIGGGYLFPEKNLNLYGVDREWVKFTGSRVYKIEQYYYPLSDLLLAYVCDFYYVSNVKLISYMGLLLSKRIKCYFIENDLDIQVLEKVEASYIYKFRNLFSTNIVRYLMANKVNISSVTKQYPADVVRRVRNIFWRVIATVDALVFNPNYKESYPNFKKEHDLVKEQESLYHLRNHMKYDIDYLLSKKMLLSNFEPLKKFLLESINAKYFKFRLFAYMFLFEYHWILTSPDQNFGKLSNSNFKHFPEFKDIQEIYAKDYKLRKEYADFKLIGDNLLYVGYEDFAKDLESFSISGVAGG